MNISRNFEGWMQHEIIVQKHISQREKIQKEGKPPANNLYLNMYLKEGDASQNDWAEDIVKSKLLKNNTRC